MAGVQPKKFGWVRTLSARENVTAWREKRKAMREEFENRQSAARNAFANAWSAKIDGAAELTVEMLAKRTQKELLAKAEQIQERAKYATEIETTKADTKDSIFAANGTGQLGSGTKIDLNSGTLTLSDGTVIDVKTGVKKVNITV